MFFPLGAPLIDSYRLSKEPMRFHRLWCHGCDLFHSTGESSFLRSWTSYCVERLSLNWVSQIKCKVTTANQNTEHASRLLEARETPLGLCKSCMWFVVRMPRVFRSNHRALKQNQYNPRILSTPTGKLVSLGGNSHFTYFSRPLLLRSSSVTCSFSRLFLC